MAYRFYCLEFLYIVQELFWAHLIPLKANLEKETRFKLRKQKEF